MREDISHFRWNLFCLDLVRTKIFLHHYPFIIVLTRLLSWKQRPTRILPTFRERMIEGSVQNFGLDPRMFRR